ncbi:MAG: O-antigen ligase family protein [Deferribacteraceae bacterium]|jgi:O-antigen ligase|nr:O-antigen ligase family protein [Deferribacteraceae bacterium]
MFSVFSIPTYFVSFFLPLSISFAQISVIPLLGVFIYKLYRGENRDFWKNPYLKYIFIVMGALALTAALGEYPAKSFKVYKQVVWLLMFIFGYYLCKGELQNIIIWFSAGGAFSFVLGLSRFFTVGTTSGYGGLEGLYRGAVRYGNAMALIAFLITAVLVFKLYKTPIVRNILLFLLLYVLAALLGSSTRGAILPFFAAEGALFLIIFKRKGALLILGFAAITLILILLVPELRFKFSPKELNIFDPATSLGWRFELWKVSWKVFLENPITGVGLTNLQSSYLIHMPVKYHSTAHAHNNVLQLLAEHGIVGFAAVSLLVLRFFIAHIKSALRKNSYGITGAVFTGLFVLEGITEYNFFDGQLSMLFWLITGTLIREGEECST